MEKTERASRTGTRDGRAEGARRKPSVLRRAAAAVREFIVELLKELGRGVLCFLASEFVMFSLVAGLFYLTFFECAYEFALPLASSLWVLLPLIGLGTKRRAVCIAVSVVSAILLIPLCAFCIATGDTGRELAGYALWVVFGLPLVLGVFFYVVGSAGEGE